MTERQVIAHCASCSARLGVGRTGSTVTLSPRDSALMALGEAYAGFSEENQSGRRDFDKWSDAVNNLNAALDALRKIEEAK